MTPANEAKDMYLKVNEDTNFGRFLTRLINNPSIRADEVGRLWRQNARGGGETDLTPTRVSFILDAVAEATGSKKVRVGKGNVVLHGIRDAVRYDEPKHAPSIVATEAKVINMHEAAKPQPKKDEPNGLVWPDAPPIPKLFPTFEKPEWYERFCKALNDGKHISIAGPPGVGKSLAAEQYAAENGIPLVTVNADGGLRRRDLTGSTELSDGTTRYEVAEYAAAAINGWMVVVNEVNAADADALLFLNGQLAAPHTVNLHGKSYPVHPDFKLVVTYNPGLAGTKPLPPAFKDRFLSFKVAFPEPDMLLKLMKANGLKDDSYGYVSPLVNFAQQAWGAHIAGTVRYQISPRRVYDAVYLIQKMNLSFKEAVQAAIIDAVDSPTDIENLKKLLGNSHW